MDITELAKHVVATYDAIIWDGSEAVYERTHNNFKRAMNDLRSVINEKKTKTNEQ